MSAENMSAENMSAENMSAENSSALDPATGPLRRCMYPCEICHHPMPLRKDGAIWVHGLVNRRCPGGGGVTIIAHQTPLRCPVDQPSLNPLTRQSAAGVSTKLVQASIVGACGVPDLSHESIQLLPLGRLLLKMIPKASCGPVASKLTTLLNRVMNDLESKKSLLSFPRRFLRVPKRGNVIGVCQSR